MASSRKMAGGLAVFAAGALAAAMIVRDSRGWGAPGPQDAGPQVELPAPGARALADDLQELFAGVAEGVRRSVVSVGAKRVSEPPPASPAPFGLPWGRSKEAIGSGFIIDRRGYVLTNAHLVAGTSDITVRLSDNRQLQARLIQADAASDVALVRIAAHEDFPALPMGESDRVRVGEWVLAVGSPFGLSQTVSAGIVSSLRRSDLNVLPFESFIQTDASINPGNSGGPLVSLRGEAIGINTALYSSPGGGNQGIGFAIPISFARALVERWIEGKSTGLLGLVAGAVDADMARYFGLDAPRGAFITRLDPGGAAERSGLKAADVILRFAGAEVKDENHLRVLAAQAPPGTPVEVVVRRGRTDKTLEVALIEQEWPDGQPAAPGAEGEAGGTGTRLLGLTVVPLTGRAAEDLGLPPDRRGIVVLDVQAGSPASRKGLRHGDVFLEVNQAPVTSLEDLREALLRSTDVIMLRVVRQGAELGYLFLPR